MMDMHAIDEPGFVRPGSPRVRALSLGVVRRSGRAAAGRTSVRFFQMSRQSRRAARREAA